MNYKHGDTNTRFYKIWCGIKERVSNKDKLYFKKGIEICSSWMDYNVFKNDMYDSYIDHVNIYGEKETTIDRINNNLGYLSDNCRWATYQEQARNRSTNITIEYDNKIMCLKDWALELKIKEHTLMARLKNGWSIKETLDIPVKNGQKIHHKTIYFNGETKSIKEWGNIMNIKPCTIGIRLKRGWSIERALNKEGVLLSI